MRWRGRCGSGEVTFLLARHISFHRDQMYLRPADSLFTFKEGRSCNLERITLATTERSDSWPF